MAVLVVNGDGAQKISVPVPDPSERTRDDLQREVSALKELIEQRIESLKELTETQFSLLDKQRVEQKADTKEAVDAALIAQKEAVKEQTTASDRAIAKSELATSKQLEQSSTTFATSISSVVAALSDLKTRVERIENVRQGAVDNRGVMFASIGGLVGIAGLAAAFLR